MNTVNDIDYVQRAKDLRKRLGMFIWSEIAPTGDDFSDVYEMLDRAVLNELVEALEFQVFKRDARGAEITVANLLTII